MNCKSLLTHYFSLYSYVHNALKFVAKISFLDNIVPELVININKIIEFSTK